MSFSGEFNFCMHGAGLPNPAEEIQGAADVIEFLEHLHTAAEAAGGVEITLGALEASGFVGLGALVGDAAAVVVSAYVGAVAGCLLAATGSTIFDLLSETEHSQGVVDDLVTAANAAGIDIPEAFAVA